MSEVVTFEGYRPPPRYDTIPWTGVRIEESADGLSGWTQIDAVALSPLDTDPKHPALRAFTTENGTALGYWYRVVFADSDGDVSQPTTAVQNVGGSAAAAVFAYATVSELARVLELRTPTGAQTDAMQRCLDAATYEVDSEVGHPSQYAIPYPPLAVEVTLERAVEHWHQSQTPWGVYQTAGVSMLVSRDSWRRHAYKLLPLKETFGVA